MDFKLHFSADRMPLLLDVRLVIGAHALTLHNDVHGLHAVEVEEHELLFTPRMGG